MFLLAALDVTALAYPYPLFAHKQQFDEFTIYSGRPLSNEYEEVIEGVRSRVTAMEYARPGAGCRVFICGESMARRLFEWHLLVEFLAEERGFDLKDLIDEAVTETFAREEMLAWYEDQRSAR